MAARCPSPLSPSAGALGAHVGHGAWLSARRASPCCGRSPFRRRPCQALQPIRAVHVYFQRAPLPCGPAMPRAGGPDSSPSDLGSVKGAPWVERRRSGRGSLHGAAPTAACLGRRPGAGRAARLFPCVFCRGSSPSLHLSSPPQRSTPACRCAALFTRGPEKNTLAPGWRVSPRVGATPALSSVSS